MVIRHIKPAGNYNKLALFKAIPVTENVHIPNYENIHSLASCSTDTGGNFPGVKVTGTLP
jgi:hypothetical protein